MTISKNSPHPDCTCDLEQSFGIREFLGPKPFNVERASNGGLQVYYAPFAVAKFKSTLLYGEQT